MDYIPPNIIPCSYKGACNRKSTCIPTNVQTEQKPPVEAVVKEKRVKGILIREKNIYSTAQ
jgi:hypothetical protein